MSRKIVSKDSKNESFLKITSYEKGTIKDKYRLLRYFKEFLFPPSSLTIHKESRPLILNPLTFVIIYENHFKQLKPIADMLVERKIDFTVIYIQEFVYNKHKNTFRNQIFINSYYSRMRYYSAIVCQGVALISTLIKNIAKSIDYRSLDYQVILKYYKLHYLLKHSFAQILSNPIEKLILFKSEGFIAKTIIQECRSAKITTFAIQHGLIGVHDMFRRVSVDNYLVWSEYFKNILEKLEACSIVSSVGCASSDKMFKQFERHALCNNGFRKDGLNVLFLPNSGHSHTSVEQVFLAVNICLEYASKHPGISLSVKPHPGDVNNNVINHIKNNFDNLDNVFFIDRFEKYDFNEYDITIINNSTAGMESAIWRKPIIVIADKLDNVQVDFYLKENIGEFANSSKDLERVICLILSNYKLYEDNCKIFVDKYFTNHGCAVEEILNKLGVKN